MPQPEKYFGITDKLLGKKPEEEKPALTLEEEERLLAIEARLKEILAIRHDPEKWNALTLEQMRPLAEEFQALKKEKRNLERKREAGKIPEELREVIEQARSSLEQALNSRFEELGSDLRFKISSPEVPEGVTPEHLEAIREIFGGNLEPMALPKPEELHNLDEEYAKVMYPPKDPARQEKDAKDRAGLVSYRPSWFDDASDKDITKSEETWGQAYLRSMAEELENLGGSLILLETTQKPDYKEGKEHYGSKEGTDPSLDPLLSLFQQVFGEEANRFNLSWDELAVDFKDKAERETFIKAQQKVWQEKGWGDYTFNRQGLESLLTALKRKILKSFQEKGLAIPDFEVILVPASAFNLQTTLFHPENSQTNTWEWNSTVLTDKDGNDSGHRLGVGDSGDGGAADVGSAHRGLLWGHGGARPAVVFLRKHTDT